MLTSTNCPIDCCPTMSYAILTSANANANCANCRCSTTNDCAKFNIRVRLGWCYNLYSNV